MLLRKCLKFLALIVMGLLPLLIMLSCNDSNSQVSNLSQRAEYTSNIDDLFYFKDTRTGTCFAGRAMGWPSGLLTYVPCNEEIEKTAIKFQSVP